MRKLAAGIIAAAAGIASLGPIAAMAPASAATAPASAPATTWLCRPGQVPDPCAGDIDVAVDPVTGPELLRTTAIPAKPPVDCFYAYPTVSGQQTDNADLAVEASQTFIAQAQAAPFSHVCRVFAPMYRQVTIKGLYNLSRPQAQRSLDIAYRSLLSGWRAFLAQEPQNAKFVVIGHSQGAAMLIRLLKEQVDPKPALRSRLLSAILLGGNLTVAAGKRSGGAFRHIPLCSSGHELHCAMAYSAFAATQPPSSGAYFGIPGQGVSGMWGQRSRSKSLEVACTSPARFGPGSARLNPLFLGSSLPEAGYTTYPSLYRGQCAWSNGAHYLRVTAVGASAYPAASHPNDRPIVESRDRQWGLHNYDPQLGLGDLVAFVARQEFFLRTGR